MGDLTLERLQPVLERSQQILSILRAGISEILEHYTAHGKGQEENLPTCGESLLISRVIVNLEEK